MVKNLPAMRENWVRSLGWEDPQEEGMAIHSSVLPGESPWTEAWQATAAKTHKESNMTEWLSTTQHSTESMN